MEISQKALKQQMLDFGVKPSAQRLAILSYLQTHFTHPTVDDIFAELSPEMPTLSKTTVYNTLKLLADSGMVSSLNLDEKNQHFDGDTRPHAHLKCTNCGRIEDVFLNNMALFELPETNCRINKVEISYSGLCSKCNSENIN